MAKLYHTSPIGQGEGRYINIKEEKLRGKSLFGKVFKFDVGRPELQLIALNCFSCRSESSNKSLVVFGKVLGTEL